MATDDGRMPVGMGDQAPVMPDRGVSTGVTDTYGADLKQGFNKVSGGNGGFDVVPPGPVRMEGS